MGDADWTKQQSTTYRLCVQPPETTERRETPTIAFLFRFSLFVEERKPNNKQKNNKKMKTGNQINNRKRKREMREREETMGDADQTNQQSTTYRICVQPPEMKERWETPTIAILFRFSLFVEKRKPNNKQKNNKKKKTGNQITNRKR